MENVSSRVRTQTHGIHRYVFNKWIPALLVCLLAAGQLTGQTPEKKITAHYPATSLVQRLKAIQEQAGITIAFDEKELSLLKVGEARFNNIPLKEVLQRTLRNFDYTWKEVEGAYVIIAKPAAPVKKNAGKLTGTIVDEQNGEPVQSATIKIDSITISSDVYGTFTLELPKGNYTAEVSSVGYGSKRITAIEIADGQQAAITVTMKRQKGNLGSVVVTATARKETAAGLYLRQKNNAAITDGISAEQMGRTPDKNIGESLKRISGLSTMDNKYVVIRGLSERYNQAMLNGQAMPSTELNRKQFSFDIIPSNMVDNVVVAKTITPDMSAEFGGGLVLVNTKDIPTENFLTFTAGTSINDRTQGKELLSLKRDGDREYFGEYATHRYLFGKKNWKNLDEIDAYQKAHENDLILSNNWEPVYYRAVPSQNYQLSLGRVLPVNKEKQQKFGLLASASYRNTQSIQGMTSSRFRFDHRDTEGELFHGDQYGFTTNMGAMLGLGYTARKLKLSWQNVFTRLLDQQLNYGKGTHEIMENDSRALIEKVQQTNLLQSQLRGEHTFGNKGIKINWTGNYTWVRRERPDNHIFLWATLPDSVKLPHNDFTVTRYYPEGLSKGVLRLFTNAVEKNYSWDISATLPFTLLKIKSSFKTGYAGWSKDRRFYVASVGHLPGSFSTYPSLPKFFTPETGGGKSFVSRFGDDYDRAANLQAVYGMFDNRIAQKLRLVWGLRAEHFDMDAANQALDATVKHITSTNGTNTDLDFSALYNREKNWKFFPSVNITYGLTPAINFRAAYSESIIRPDLREMAWFREYDFELGGSYESNFLRSTLLKNYDLRAEWYPGAGEIASVSFFYKDLEYPMEIYKHSNNIYQLKNNYKSHNYGLELEIRKSLSFINFPVVKRLSVFGNFTALASKVTPMKERTNMVVGRKIVPEVIIGKEEKRPLMGQSNYMGNAGLSYDDTHLHITINYNTISNRMVVYEGTPIGSEYEKPLSALDAQIAYRFLKKQLEVKINLSNLLNKSSIIYLNGGTPEEEQKASTGDYSTKYLLYDRKKDFLYQELIPGRTYGISITYTLK